MESQQKQGRSTPAFQPAPPSKSRVVAGVAAAIAVSSFAFLVLGALADQRALALAGYAEPIAAKTPVGDGAPRKQAGLSRIVSRELEKPL